MSKVVSIITAVRNNEAFIEETICSVLEQTYPHIEYILIDGASTDGTLEVINRYKDRLSYFISEKDESMYDAINKGLVKATGDFILNLNSDDLLSSKSIIEELMPYLKGEDAYYCNIIKKTEKGERRVNFFQVDFKELLLSRHCTFLPHPTLLISRALLKKIPQYNLSFRYASDFDYILTALKLSTRICHLPIYLTKFRLHAGSITASGCLETERNLVLQKHEYASYSIFSRSFYFIYLWLKYKIINKFKTSFKD